MVIEKSSQVKSSQQKGDGPHGQQMAAGPSPQGAHEPVGVLVPMMQHGDQTTH